MSGLETGFARVATNMRAISLNKTLLICFFQTLWLSPRLTVSLQPALHLSVRSAKLP